MKPTYSAIPSFLANFAENQITKHVLLFWRDSAINPNGGLFGAVSHTGVADVTAPQGAIMNARALWSFSQAYQHTADPQYLNSATHLFKAFSTNFVDQQYGGVYWSINADGTPLEDHKHTLAQAYGLFAASLYYQISQDSEALMVTQNLIAVTQAHFIRLDGTYLTQLSRSFEGPYDEANASIETCNQLHMLEAITQYIKSTQDTSLVPHLEDLIDLFLLRIFPAQNHLTLRFTQNWVISGEEVSYGHNFETGYLVCLACEVLGDEVRLAKAQKQLVRLVDYSIEHCKHSSGSYKFGIDKQGKEATTLLWWPQTEASNALIMAAKITNDDRYYDELITLWESINAHWVDNQQGEWFSELNLSLDPAGNTNKADFWRSCYHTTRACFHVARGNQNGMIQPPSNQSTRNIV